MRRFLAMMLTLALALGLGAIPALGAEEFEPVVLVDNDDIAVTVTGYDPNGENGPAFDFLLENKTDKELEFSRGGLAVNGVMLNNGFYETVEANSELSTRVDLFWPGEQEEMGIRYVQDVLLYLLVLAEEDGMYDSVYEDLLSWSVPGAGDGGPAVEEPVSDGGIEPIEVLSGDLTVTVNDVKYIPSQTLLIQFAVKNDGDRILQIESTDIKINGIAADRSWFVNILPGTSYSGYFSLMAEDIQRVIGSDTVETLDFGMSVMDESSWDEIDEGQFTLDMDSFTSEPAPTAEPAATLAPTAAPAPTEDPAMKFSEESFEEDLETSDPVTLSTGGETVVAVLPDDQFFEQFSQKSNIVTMMEYSDDRGVGSGRAYLRLEDESDPEAYVAETVGYNADILQEVSSEDAVTQTSEPVTETINGMPVTWAKITQQSTNLFGQQMERVQYYAAAPAGRFLVTLELVYSYVMDGGIAMDDSIVTDIYENIFTGEDAAEAAAAKAAEANEFEEFVELGNENGALMAVTDFEPNGNSAEMGLYLENDTDSTVVFSLDDVEVNGFYYNPFWSEEVGPQSSEKSTVKWDAAYYADLAELVPNIAEVAENVAGIERFEVIHMTVTAQVKDTEEVLFSVPLGLDVTDEYDD